MDKCCKGCFYQVFADNDLRKSWGYCGYPDIVEECKSNMNPDVDLPNMNAYLKGVFKHMPKDAVLSCMLVQTCFDGKCQHYEKTDYEKMDKEKEE